MGGDRTAWLALNDAILAGGVKVNSGGAYTLAIAVNDANNSSNAIGDLQLLHDRTGLVMWMPMPRGTAAAEGWLGADGNFALCGPPPEDIPRGPTLWSTGTRNKNVDALVIREDRNTSVGTVELVTADGTTVWSSPRYVRSVDGDTLYKGDLLVAYHTSLISSGDYRLSCGNTGVELHHPAGFQANFGPSPEVLDGRLVRAAGLNPQGDFAIYTDSPDLYTEVWSTGTSGLDVVKLMVRERYFALYSAEGTEVWRSDQAAES